MQKVTKSSRIFLVRGWKFWNKPQQVCTTTTPGQRGKQKNPGKQVAAFLRSYITFLQDMHSLVRRSRDRLLYPNRFLANSSGLWTSHELSGFQTLLDVRESEAGSPEIFSALWIQVLTPSTILHVFARQWKAPLPLFVLGSHSEDRSLPLSILPTPAARRGAGRRTRRWRTADACRLVQPCQRPPAHLHWPGAFHTHSGMLQKYFKYYGSLIIFK